MAYTKCECKDNETVITAQMMNDIQDAICGAEKNIQDLQEVPQTLEEHTKNKSNPHGVTAAQVGARPDTWMPTASDVGARPNTWTPTAEEVGARPNTWTPTAAQVGARSNTWMPSASDVGARPNTWMPTAEEVGALPSSGGTVGGAVTVSGNINAANEFLSGSLYVGGKKSTTDGKAGVAFGASGNITMQGSSTPTLNFIDGTKNSAINKIVGQNGEFVIYGDKILSMYTVPAEGGVYGVNIVGGTGGALRPNGTAAGAITLGQDGRRFNTIYLVNAANVNSDRNAKTDIHDIDERFVALFDRLEPVSYKLTGGNHDRNHLGFISQDVKVAMDEVGISDMEFGGYCRDAKVDHETGEPILDENGDPIYTYSLRYGEFIALNSRMIQLNRATIQAQQEEITELRAELAELRRLLVNK